MVVFNSAEEVVIHDECLQKDAENTKIWFYRRIQSGAC